MIEALYNLSHWTGPMLFLFWIFAFIKTLGLFTREKIIDNALDPGPRGLYPHEYGDGFAWSPPYCEQDRSAGEMFRERSSGFRCYEGSSSVGAWCWSVMVGADGSDEVERDRVWQQHHANVDERQAGFDAETNRS